MSEPSLQYYTIADLRNWLIYSQPPQGLSDKIIAPQRAFSIMNNPYVKDDDAIVSVIFEDGEVAAYTAIFPEKLEYPTDWASKRIWWFTTLACTPRFEGRGYGLVVCSFLQEMHPDEPILDIDGATETVEIMKMMGLTPYSFVSYRFQGKYIDLSSFKGKLAYKKECLLQTIRSKKRQLLVDVSQACYSLKYPSTISSDLFAFVKKCGEGDLLIRTVDTFNWIVQYPFMKPAPIFNRVECQLCFSSEIDFYSFLPVIVYDSQDVIAFYLLRNCPWGLSVKYLYYIPEAEKKVFLSIVEHLIMLGNPVFETTNSSLAAFINSYHLFSRCIRQSKSISLPHNCSPLSQNIQGGDGDMFV